MKEHFRLPGRNSQREIEGNSMKKPKRLSRETIYTSSWVALHVDKVEYPSGKIVDRHHVIELLREGAAVVVTNERDEVLLIRSYRYTVDSIEWEIPAGGVDKGETLFEAAGREVREETGYESHSFRKIYTYYPMTGVSSAVDHLVAAKAGRLVSRPDPTEVESTAWKSRDEVRKMIERNEIRDGFSLTGLLFWLGSAEK